MKKVLILMALLLGSTQAEAMDHRSQFGFGSSLGGTIPAPWASPAFKSAVGTHLPAAGIWARYIPGTPEVGLELGYNYFDLAQQNIHTHAVILSFISRQNPWGSFHPFYGFGMGYSTSDNWYATGVWEAPIFKFIAGVDFELNNRTDIGFQIDHYSIFKNQPTEPNLHVITPVVTFNYYFGTPAPLPAPPAPAAPTAAPVTSPRMNPVAPTAKPVTSATSPRAKPKTVNKSATKKKKPTATKKKKKVIRTEEPSGTSDR